MSRLRVDLTIAAVSIAMACLIPPAFAQDLPDRAGFDEETRDSIELACIAQKSEGPAAYGRCLTQQIQALKGSPGIPSLSSLHAENRDSIQLACITQKSEGPVAYGDCLRAQLQSIGVAPTYPPHRAAGHAKPAERKASLSTAPSTVVTYPNADKAYRVASQLWHDPVIVASLIVAFVVLTPFIWVLFSSRSHGGAKFGWFLAVLFFSWLGLAAFLIVTQAQRKRPGDSP